MYTRERFGRELKEKVAKRLPVHKIGEWAHTMYIEHIEDIDDNFMHILITLNTMELSPEFERTYEELDKIANDLISGNEVNLFPPH